VETGRLLGSQCYRKTMKQAGRGTKAKSIMSCNNASVTNLVLLLSLRFRTKNICCCRFAFAQKTSVAVASLSHRARLPASERRVALATSSSSLHVVDFFDRKSLFFDKSPNSFDKMRFCFDISSNSFDKERFCFDKTSKYSYKTNESSFSDSVLDLDTK